jgi:Flp pilus assembly pilin Flp
MMNRSLLSARGESGVTLIEVAIALTLLTLGILAVGRLLPLGARSELAGRMQSTACQYANEEFETLRGVSKQNSALSLGRHPAAGFDTLGTKKSWRRCYVVSSMAAPLDSLLKLDTTIYWKSSKPESLSLSGYLMP